MIFEINVSASDLRIIKERQPLRELIADLCIGKQRTAEGQMVYKDDDDGIVGVGSEPAQSYTERWLHWDARL